MSEQQHENPEVEASGPSRIAEVVAEVRAAASRIANTDQVNVKSELVHNLYPILELLGEAMAKDMAERDERLQDIEDAVAELIEGQSVITPDLAAQIQGTLVVGLHLCDGVVAFADLVSRNFQDLGGEPLELPEPLANLVTAFRSNAVVTRDLVAQVTSDSDDGDEDENDDSDSDDGGDEADGGNHQTFQLTDDQLEELESIGNPK